MQLGGLPWLRIRSTARRQVSGDLEMRRAIGAVPAQRDEAIGRLVDPDSGGVGGEVRTSGVGERGDELRRTAGGGNPDQVRQYQLGIDLVVDDGALGARGREA